MGTQIVLSKARQAIKDQREGVLISPAGYTTLIEEMLIALEVASRTRPTHEELVTTLAKPGEAILATMTPEKMDLFHMAVGVAGEGGELLDWVKKHVIYNTSLDLISKEGKTIKEHILEELADSWFYQKKIMLRFGWTVETLEQYVITKLLERYSGMVYTDQAAQARADKPPGPPNPPKPAHHNPVG